MPLTISRIFRDPKGYPPSKNTQPRPTHKIFRVGSTQPATRVRNLRPDPWCSIFYAKGTKKSLIQLTHAFGLTSSYTTIVASVNRLKNLTREEIKAYGARGKLTVAYDNYKLTINVTQ